MTRPTPPTDERLAWLLSTRPELARIGVGGWLLAEAVAGV